MAWIALSGGLAAAWILLFKSLRALFWTPADQQVPTLIVVMAFTPFLFAALWVCWHALTMLAGHREIELSEDRLCVIERVGFLRRRRKYALGKLRSLLVVGLSNSETPGPADDVMERFAALITHTDEGSRVMLAPAYPRSMLVPIAERLEAERHAVNAAAGKIEAEIESVDEEELELHDEATTDHEPAAESDGARHGVIQRPADSRIVVDRSRDGLVLRVPPAGIRRGGQGLFGFSIVWCAFMAVFSIFGVPGFASADSKSLLFVVPLVCLFWAVGIGMMLAAVNMGRRRAAIALNADQLSVIQTGLRRSKTRQWALADVVAVRVGPSGLSVNDRPVVELQIHTGDGAKFGMLAGHDPAELNWMAALLGRELQNDRDED